MTDHSPLAGKTVELSPQMGDVALNGQKIVIEDWWERVSAGVSWAESVRIGSPAAIFYSLRINRKNKLVPMDDRIPIDNRVLYGKVNGLGFIVHISEVWEGKL
jgi:hypothetical protein